MAELWFYQLQHSDVTRALPSILERCLAKGWRALVRGTDPASLEALDLALWTFRADAFLPHGREVGGVNEESAARNPIWLTHTLGNPNKAQALFLIDEASAPDAAAFERACHVFDGARPAAVAKARTLWREGKSAGFALAYWCETEAGSWQKEA